MDPRIITKEERPRGCGHRKVGGLYFVAPKFGASCGMLPAPLRACPCCGGGIKQARGFTWVDGAMLLRSSGKPCSRSPAACEPCPVGRIVRSVSKQIGLIWIGRKFYATPEDFIGEANVMGISRRVPRVPKGFKVGEDFIMLAHALTVGCSPCAGTGQAGIVDCEQCNGQGRIPGAFALFRPAAIEVIVDPNAPEEKIDALVKRGLTPVAIRQLDESGTPVLPEMEGDDAEV